MLNLFQKCCRRINILTSIEDVIENSDCIEIEIRFCVECEKRKKRFEKTCNDFNWIEYVFCLSKDFQRVCFITWSYVKPQRRLVIHHFLCHLFNPNLVLKLRSQESFVPFETLKMWEMYNVYYLILITFCSTL